MSDRRPADYVHQRRAAYAALADRVWSTPELNWREHLSAAAHAETIAAERFRPLPGLAGFPTATGGEAGRDGAVIAILGEYDALPSLSQQAGVAAPVPLTIDGNGHGCGHNLLGAASLMAAAAVKDWLDATGTPGRIRYIGCPAEEGGSSKSFMVREGLFDDVDAAICWHPSSVTGVIPPRALANVEVEFTFRGRASHAASAPHLGRSALDAVELMNVGVNYLREHMPIGARLHYAITDAGGTAPNVVQAQARVRHLVRTRTLPELWPLLDRVVDVARGAALMTGTAVEWVQVSGDADMVSNELLEALMDKVLRGLDGAGFDEADNAFAREVQASIAPDELASARDLWRAGSDMPLFDAVVPRGSGRADAYGSTDVGSVSWVVPTVQCWATTCAIGTPAHSWQMVAQGCAPAAHKGMTLAAKAMAEVAAALFSDAALLGRAKAEHAAFRAGNPFKNPVEGVKLRMESGGR